jgi:hypothetical protein
MPTILGACQQYGNPGLRVDQPSACEEVLKEVGDPGYGNRDARAALYRTRLALKQANATIRKGRECFQGQRAAYSAGTADAWRGAR